MNPRESYFEDIFDDFATEQSAPLEYNSPFNNFHSNSFLSLSSHSSTSASNHRIITTNTTTTTVTGAISTHSINNKSTNADNNNYNIMQYKTTPTEDLQLEQLVLRLNKIYHLYESAHKHTFSNNQLSYHNNLNNSPRNKSIQSSSSSKKQHMVY